MQTYGEAVSPYADSDGDGVSNYWEANCPDEYYDDLDYTDLFGFDMTENPFYTRACWSRHFNEEQFGTGPL